MLTKRKLFILTIGLALSAQATEKPLNILLIFTDDHATQAIGAYGSTLIETPNIDRLAERGVVFDNSFCGNSICGPSRATVLTGLHSHQHGFSQATGAVINRGIGHIHCREGSHH